MKAGSSGWLAVAESVTVLTPARSILVRRRLNVGEMYLNEFDFDALLNVEDLETMSGQLLAILVDTYDFFASLRIQRTNQKSPLAGNTTGHLPESLTKTDQVTSFTFL